MTATPYGVSKLAVRGLTSSFATELAPRPDPGQRDRPRSDGHRERARGSAPRAVDDFVREQQLVHRLGTMDDIVSAMLFLCSAEGSFITGETIKVSGGFPLNF